MWYLKKILMKGAKIVNKQLLKGLIVQYDGTQLALAEAMGLSLSRLNAKINENNADFTQNEIAFIKNRYNLTNNQVVDIFFSAEVS